MPVRANSERTPDGKVAAAKRWADLLGQGGRLDRIRGLVSTAPTNAVNLLIDPAVLDTAADLAGGNQAADLGGSQTDEAKDDSSATPNDLAADQWLRSVRQLGGVQNNFCVPFADPDVSSLARHDRALLRTAKQQGAASLAKHTIHAQPMLAPIDGQFDPKLLDKLGNLPVLIDSDTADTEDGLSAADYATSGKAQLVFADSLLAEGGPDGGPDGANRFDALGLRQLILATASLRQTDVGGQTKASAPTLVVSLPRLWDRVPTGRRRTSSMVCNNLGCAWSNCRPQTPRNLPGASTMTPTPRCPRAMSQPRRGAANEPECSPSC
ncbi:MAG: hypothetical protein R2709_10995 [Marmoricola sp.]